jgi:D-alanine-D-alanine ligase
VIPISEAKEIIRPYKVWVLAPHLVTSDTRLNQYYDFSQSIQEYTRVFDELGIDWEWQPVTIQNYREIICSIVKSDREKAPLIINLCDGDEINGTPGLSVIKELEKYNIVYTGSDKHFYEITTSKTPMKKAFEKAGIPTPAWRVISDKKGSAKGLFKRIGKPLLIKPAVSGGSMGISLKNLVHTEEQLEKRIEELKRGYHGWNLFADGLIAEQFISGREFTTFITGSSSDPKHCKVYEPVERVFHSSLPESERFLSFGRLWEIYEEETPLPGNDYLYEYKPVSGKLVAELKKISLKAYGACGGMGYTRIDIRQDTETGKLFLLEANAQCGLSEDQDYTSIGAILNISGVSFTEVVAEILLDGIRREMKKTTGNNNKKKFRNAVNRE